MPALAASGRKTNLVVVMLRGGMDACRRALRRRRHAGEMRPDINVSRPMKVSGDFALHPELKTFKSLWDKGRAAVFHAMIPYTGRSHFEGQYLMESGGTIPYYDKTGGLAGRSRVECKSQRFASMPLLRGCRIWTLFAVVEFASDADMLASLPVTIRKTRC